MDERLLVPATRALLDGWCGPVVYRDGSAWRSGTTYEADGGDWIIVSSDPVFDRSDRQLLPLLTVPLSDLALDLSRAEARDRVGRLLTRTDEHPEGWPACIQWDAGLGCWELWWVAEQLETRDVVYDLGVPWTVMAALTPEDEHAALAAVAREVLRG